MLINGDSKQELKKLNANSIDSLITDPPAGISFMGKDWDDYGSLDNFQNEMKEIFSEVYRVLKPGSHGLVWSIPRTSHHTAMALERCGFEIRDVITHLFGSGFPKSLDVSKAIDNKFGAVREVVGENHSSRPNSKIKGNKGFDLSLGEGESAGIQLITKPSTPEAQQWSGFGTALKPACEFWILIRKPLSEKTVADNVLKWGTGALNIDGSRIGIEKIKPCGGDKFPSLYGDFKKCEESYHQGRFPANLVLDEEAAKMLDEQSGYLHPSGNKKETKGDMIDNGMFGNGIKRPHRIDGLVDFKGGGASRFFYCAKVSTRERNEGLEEFPEKDGGFLEGNTDLNNSRKIGARPDVPPAKVKNNHPTVKSLKLMSYLIKLITPPNGTVLDCFMGSGSTGCACAQLGFNFIGIEREKEYFEIAEKRIAFHANKLSEVENA